MSKILQRSISILISASLSAFSTSGIADDTVENYYAIAKDKCHDIPCIRKEMDRINNLILLLLSERAAFALRAGDLKLNAAKQSGRNPKTAQADDEERRNAQAQIIAKKSEELGLPQTISGPAFNEIMINTVKFQQEYINRIVQQEKDFD